MNKQQKIETIVTRLERVAQIFETTIQVRDQHKTICYRNELENVVDVLKSTKSSFHSKQLKELRERIEKILNQSCDL